MEIFGRHIFLPFLPGILIFCLFHAMLNRAAAIDFAANFTTGFASFVRRLCYHSRVLFSRSKAQLPKQSILLPLKDPKGSVDFAADSLTTVKAIRWAAAERCHLVNRSWIRINNGRFDFMITLQVLTVPWTFQNIFSDFKEFILKINFHLVFKICLSFLNKLNIHQWKLNIHQ